MIPAPWLIAAAAVLIAAVAVFALYAVVRQVERARLARAEAVASAHTLKEALLGGRAGIFTWSPEEDAAGSPGLAAALGLLRSGRVTFADITDALTDTSARALNDAVQRLRDDGSGFSLTLRGTRDRYFQAVGKRIAERVAGGDVLWLQDVSERAGSLAHLETENKRLRGLIDAIPMPVWNRDADLRIVDCNTAYVRAVEATSRDAVIVEGREIAEGELTGAARNLAKRALADKAPQSESHHIVVGGSRRLMDISEQPIDGGRATAGYALDKTALESRSLELARVMAAHEQVLEHLATAISVWGVDQKLRFFNGAFVKLWSLDEDWLRKSPDLGEFLDDLRERRMLPETGDFRAFKQERLGWFTSLLGPQEELLHLPNDTSIWTVVSPHPLGGLLLTAEDVTDRLQLERNYNTLIDVQRASLDNLYEGVAVFGEDGTLRLSNPVFQRLWRFSDEFLASTPHISDVVEKCKPHLDYGDDWARFKRSYVNRVTGRMTRTGRMNRTDDMVLTYAIVPLPDGGVLMSFRDISDTIRVERALRERNEALEAADRLKSEFVANVSYELRTPLNTIIGFTEILNNQYFGALNPRQSEYTEGVLEASHRLLSLINDILDLAVIEAGRMMLDAKPFQVRAMLESVIGLTNEWAREQDLRLEFHAANDIGAIEGDERRLKHAIFNLLSNAIKFTPPGGRIQVGARRDGDTVEFVVEDSGIGIPEDDQARVFDKFVRGQGPEGSSAGAGLGLALVKSFIQLHGGTTKLVSMPNKGTRVVCRLPSRQKAQQIVAPSPQRASATLGSARATVRAPGPPQRRPAAE